MNIDLLYEFAERRGFKVTSVALDPHGNVTGYTADEPQPPATRAKTDSRGRPVDAAIDELLGEFVYGNDENPTRHALLFRLAQLFHRWPE